MDPFAAFSDEASTPPSNPPTTETVQQFVEFNPFGQLDELAKENPVEPPTFTVTVTEEPKQSEQAQTPSSTSNAPEEQPQPKPASSSNFAGAHAFAAPDQTSGETPVRIPVTPIKGNPIDAVQHLQPEIGSQSASSTSSSQPDKSQMEISGVLEKLAEGFLRESWNPRWCAVKHNRLGYYNTKQDVKPKGFVYFDEADVGLPTNLAHSPEYENAFQISHERKNLNWFFRAPNTETQKKWLAVMSANIKHYKSLSPEPTILEKIMCLACVKDQVTADGLTRSFHFYTSKSSTGFYATILCILLELQLRKIIDIVNTDEIILSADAKYTGMGLYDDTLDLIATKIKASPTKSVKVTDMLPILLYGGGLVGSLGYSLGPDAFLAEPVLRAIDHSVRRGTLEKIGPKRWIVKNTKMEEQLIAKVQSLLQEPYKGTDVRDHIVLGIAYSMLRAATKSPGADQQQHDIVDRLKIFPKLTTNAQMETALEAMAKNLGAFDKKQATLLKLLHTATVEFILGPVTK